jgi:predicted small secreted protein
MFKRQFRLTPSLVAVAVLLTACATPRGDGSAGTAGGSSSDSCVTWLVAGAIGGLLTQGGKSKGNKAGGALVGGAAAYGLCKAITSAKYTVQQTKSEQQVKEEYTRTAGKPAPNVPTVTAHELQVNQERGKDAKGKGVTLVNVRSNINVVGGGQGSPRVEEQVVLLAPDGKTKLGDIKKTAGSAGGGYGANTQITMPDGLDDGQYEIRHVVLLDNAAKSERTARFSYVASLPVRIDQLAWVDFNVQPH